MSKWSSPSRLFKLNSPGAIFLLGLAALLSAVHAALATDFSLISLVALVIIALLFLLAVAGLREESRLLS